MKTGEVIIFPTDTLYGLAAKLYDKKGLNRIYEIKCRDKSKTLPILVDSIVTINPIANYDYKTLNVMTKFWPGPLTIILKSKQEFIEKTGEESVGFRIPNHYLALDLISENGPLRTTSVNLSGQSPLNSYQEVVEKFGNQVDHIYGEHVSNYINVASTIIDVSSGEIKLVREGAIPFQEILEVYNK